MSSSRSLIGKTYTPEENHVRSLLYERQMKRIHHTDAVHSSIKQGYEYADLPATHCPDALEVSKRLQQHNGRQLTNAKNPYLSDPDRFAPLHDKHFPATNYIRTMDEIEFTPLPDLAHDYFGHMPQIFHPKLVQLQRDFAHMYHHANATQKKELYSLARYIIEYSVVKEDNIPKIFGAGLLSSPGDFQRFLDQKFELVPADLETIVQTDRSPDKPHTRLFIHESLDDMIALVKNYQKRIQRTEINKSLQREFQFKSFEQAMQWMQECIPDISKLDHHPERSNIYNRVDVVLHTHDAGNIATEKDHTLAKVLDNHYDMIIVL